MTDCAGGMAGQGCREDEAGICGTYRREEHERSSGISVWGNTGGDGGRHDPVPERGSVHG